MDLIAATGLVILLKFDPNQRFFSSCDLEIWCITLKNNRAPLLYYIKLCVSFQIHRWIQTEVTLQKRSIGVEIGDFLSLVTLEFDGWPWKTIGHLFYTTSSFVHHSKSIGEFKVELQSGNPQFWSKSAIFVQCDLEIWRMTLKNNRAPLLCCFKLCASFHSLQWIETGVRAQKRLILLKIDISFWRVTLKFNGWPSKTIGHLFYATSSFVQHSVLIGEFKLELQSGNAQSWSNSTIFKAERPWNLTDDLAKQ